MFLRSRGAHIGEAGKGLFPKPRSEQVDVEIGMRVDSFQDVHEVSKRVDTVNLAGNKKRLNPSDDRRAELDPAKHPFLGTAL
jgi:hypothetical protein